MPDESRARELKAKLSPHRCRSALQSVQRDARIPGIEQAIESAAAGLHSRCHGSFCKTIFFLRAMLANLLHAFECQLQILRGSLLSLLNEAMQEHHSPGGLGKDQAPSVRSLRTSQSRFPRPRQSSGLVCHFWHVSASAASWFSAVSAGE
jgi:hypothetical protein